MVAYALAGTVRRDLTTEPIGYARDGQPVFLRDLWPSPAEVEDVILGHCYPSSEAPARTVMMGVEADLESAPANGGPRELPTNCIVL